MTSEERDNYSVNDLTRDLDELAGRFRRRFQVDDGGGGDTGKASDLLSSISETGNLVANLDEAASQQRASRQSPHDGDISKDVGAGTRVKRLFNEIDQVADQYRRKFPATDGDTGKDGEALNDFFKDLDMLAGLHRDRLTRSDGGGGGDTGKDGEFRAAKANVGRLIDDLDSLAKRYRDRIVDGGGGDTGKAE
ncbi:hypothetical protein [Pseudarthrobacter sp. L1SW]|uniref:hypothetical protein n=1 Tax=Pseudarthrobacter sp. L1SW TaxID=2851598 RepID=UPI001E436D15|nr:hypothetical protein [Pseudarthrobacter sp. L1SW]UEL30065.1 hypothetical protein KTR40_08245 [Pseudarthrobacter sp. L1SW]